MPRFAHIVTDNAVNDLTTKSLSSHSATRPHVDDVVFGVVGNAVKNSRNSEAHDKTDERQMLFYTISLLTSATKAQAKEWHPIEGIDLGFKLQMAFGSPVVAENYDCALIDKQGEMGHCRTPQARCGYFPFSDYALIQGRHAGTARTA